LPVLSAIAKPPHQVACYRAEEIDALAVTSAPAQGKGTDHGSARSADGGHALAAVVRERGGRGLARRRSSGGATPLGGDAPKPDAAVVVRNLGKAFGAHEAIRDVSFSLDAGKALALVGESGSGKTTTLRIVVGLERQDRGQVTLMKGPRPQMIFQDVGASLTPWMTVLQLLQERLRCERVPREQWSERIDAVLALTGLLPDMRDKRPGRLSGGQRQRVALARSVIVAPPLLVCDEPTSALDVSLASTALNLLNSLRSELGMAMLIVTHDLAVARATAERIAVMQDGEIVERGDTGQVLSSPASDYTRQLLAAVPSIGGGPDGVR